MASAKTTNATTRGGVRGGGGKKRTFGQHGRVARGEAAFSWVAAAAMVTAGEWQWRWRRWRRTVALVALAALAAAAAVARWWCLWRWYGGGDGGGDGNGGGNGGGGGDSGGDGPDVGSLLKELQGRLA